MNYQKVYNALIAKRRQHPIAKVRVGSKYGLYDGSYTETHHIIPKCMGGTNTQGNLIELSAREHFVAHKLLFKAYLGTQFESSLANAFWQMCYCRKDKAYKINKSSRQFAREKRLAIEVMSKQLRGRIHINDGKHSKYVKPERLQEYLDRGYILGILREPWNKGRHDLPPSAMAGKHHTLETRRKISAKCKGAKMPDSMKEKIRRRMLGNKICLGMHPSEETRVLRSKSLLNRVRINNGQRMKYVLKSELQPFLDAGWNLGMIPLSEETRHKLSLANKGKVPVNKGKKLSPETCLKMSLAKRGKPPNNKGKHYKIHHHKS